MLKKSFEKHPEIFTFVSLAVILFFIFIVNIGSYPLMDIDETRYASMARDMFNTGDFTTLKLNGEFFFEKPPLYFWLECLSFAFFGKVNEFTVRFPVALTGFLSPIVLYFFAKKCVSRKFAFISALILATCAEFVILAKFSILDTILAFFVQLSVVSGFLTFFVSEKSKKYCWWAFYAFSGCAVMAKGIPGAALPVSIMFFASIWFKKFKEIFKPSHILPGLALFFAITLPWHVAMLKTYSPAFFNEYIMKHHIARFLNSESIGRKQPVWFFAVTLLWGLFPWTIPFLATLKKRVKKSFGIFKKQFKTGESSNGQKFAVLNLIGAIVTFLFFSASSTKLVTYILPIYFLVAPLIAFVFDSYTDKKHDYALGINISSGITGGIFFLAGIGAAFAKYYLPEQLFADIAPAQPFCVALFTVCGLLMTIFAVRNAQKALFAVYVAFMLLLSSVGTGMFFKIDYKFGQDDLIAFARKAEAENRNLVSFGFGRRFSLNYYYNKHVNYIIFPEYETLNYVLKDKNTVVIVKNKDLPDTEKHAKFEQIAQGRKYTLIRGI